MVFLDSLLIFSVVHVYFNVSFAITVRPQLAIKSYRRTLIIDLSVHANGTSWRSNFMLQMQASTKVQQQFLSIYTIHFHVITFILCFFFILNNLQQSS
jgi:hypothetical protein